MFADIVPEQLRSTVYAFDRSFEGAVAACAAPLVGKPLLLQLYTHTQLPTHFAWLSTPVTTHVTTW